MSCYTEVWEMKLRYLNIQKSMQKYYFITGMINQQYKANVLYKEGHILGYLSDSHLIGSIHLLAE